MNEAPDPLDAEAREVLAHNDRGGYTVPNRRVYPFQWNWDSAFVALGFATFDEDRAWRELETLFKGQWADGMVPSIVFHAPSDDYYPGPPAWGTTHVPPTTGISQPPVAATAIRVLVETATGHSAHDRAARLFPKLLAWHRWWHEVRDPDGTGLVTVVHPWETGRDNSTDWDEPLAAVVPTVSVAELRKDNRRVDPAERPTDGFYDRVMTLVAEARALGWDGPAVARGLSFRVCDLGVQCILARADRDLLALAGRLGEAGAVAELRGWIARSDAAMARLQGPDGLARSMDLRSGRLAPVPGSAAFLTLYARTASADDAARLAQTLRAWSDACPVAVPSCSPSAPGFDASRYWRGPVWAVVNRMVADGFDAYGHRDVATRIRRDTAAAIRIAGFREYFDPRTGAGLGGEGFSWTAAMWLSWCGSPTAPDRLTPA